MVNYHTLCTDALKEMSHAGDKEALRERLIRDYQAEMDVMVDEGVAEMGGLSIAQCTNALIGLTAGDDVEKWNY